MDIYTIIYRYIKGDATTEEERLFLHWLEEDESHEKEYLSLRRVFNLNVWNTEATSTVEALSAQKNPTTQETSFAQEPPIAQKKRFSPKKIAAELLKIAAVLCAGMLITYFLMNDTKLPEAQMQTVYVPSGQRTELILSDGTKVWLNSGTTLTFSEQFYGDTREVTLDGEAYLQVAKDEKRPFVVHTEYNDIRVLGTEFNVKAYKNKTLFEAALLEGCIEVFSENTGQSFVLNSNETLSLKDGRFAQGQIDDFNYFKWREGLICFENEALEALFAKLELYYDIRIENTNKSLQKGLYTGKFRTRDGVEHVLRVLQLKHRFEYTKDDDRNVIIIK